LHLPETLFYSLEVGKLQLLSEEEAGQEVEEELQKQAKEEEEQEKQGKAEEEAEMEAKKRKVPEVQTSPRNDSQQVLPDLNEEVQVEENTVQGRRQGCCEFECTSYNAPCIFQ
jgi:hypothetical protein